jgi:hypothetical protein
MDHAPCLLLCDQLPGQADRQKRRPYARYQPSRSVGKVNHDIARHAPVVRDIANGGLAYTVWDLDLLLAYQFLPALAKYPLLETWRFSLIQPLEPNHKLFVWHDEQAIPFVGQCHPRKGELQRVQRLWAHGIVGDL